MTMVTSAATSSSPATAHTHPSITKMATTHNYNHQPRVVKCFERLILVNSGGGGGTDQTAGFKNRAHRRVIADLRTHFSSDESPCQSQLLTAPLPTSTCTEEAVAPSPTLSVAPLPQLVNLSQLKGRPGYGKGTMKRIEEIMLTGGLKELNVAMVGAHGCATPNTTTDTNGRNGGHIRAQQGPSAHGDTAIQELVGVTGIGPVKARAIVESGGSLAQLREAAASQDTTAFQKHKLTKHQRLGLKYYSDLLHRIPKHIIGAFDQALQAKCYTPEFPCSATICGSYRRGKPDSGDIDVLLTHPDWAETGQAEAGLHRVLHQLEAEGQLVDHLTSTARCKTKYMGFLRIPGYAHACRIDIRAVVYRTYIPALAYFTGSSDENVRLRGIALKKRMKLNEYALVDVDSGEDIALHSEEQLYALLDQVYVKPTSR